MKKKWIICVALFLVSLVYSNTVQALTVRLNFSKLTTLADAIVVGKVVSSNSLWNDEHNNIYTEVVVSVEDMLKGKSEKKTVTIIVPGGTVGDLAQWVEDTPAFVVGEQIGIFLEDLNSTKVSQMGLNQAFQMAPDSSVGQIIGGLKGKWSLDKDNQPPGKGMSASSFKQQVQKALDGQTAPEIEDQEFFEQSTSHLKIITISPSSAPSSFKQQIQKDLDGRTTFEIEDQEFFEQPASYPDLQIFTISPSSASAGSNTLVTVTGSGFGTPAPGYNGLCFFRRYLYYPSVGGLVPNFICNEYSSWSDTQISAHVPKSASSGPMFVLKGNTDGPMANFTVTFGFSGVDWFGNNPDIIYKVNANGIAGRLEAVQAGVSAWNNAGARLTFSYGGTHNQTQTGYNGVNEVLWQPLTTGTLGLTTTWFHPTSGEIYECDFAFNANVSWSYAATCPPGQYDVQSIATHEFGHWLNLSDLYGEYRGYTQDISKMMFGHFSDQWIKRTLHPNDILGIKWIYGSSGPAWSRLSVDNPENMVAAGSLLYADFGVKGLWMWDRAEWTRISVDNPENMVAAGSLLYADFGVKGLWIWDGAEWSLLSWDNPENMVVYGRVLFADFGALGLWAWSGNSGWYRLTVDNPENMVLWWDNGLLVDFGVKGLWVYDGAEWSLLSWDNPENMVVDAGWWPRVDFGALGLWTWYGNSGWYRLTVDNPENMAAHNSILYADFGAKGIWMWDGSASTWSRLIASNPETILTSGSTLYADFGPSGLWMWDRSAWTLLTMDNPENMVGCDSALYVDFGAKGLWIHDSQ